MTAPGYTNALRKSRRLIQCCSRSSLNCLDLSRFPFEWRPPECLAGVTCRPLDRVSHSRPPADPADSQLTLREDLGRNGGELGRESVQEIIYDCGELGRCILCRLRGRQYQQSIQCFERCEKHTASACRCPSAVTRSFSGEDMLDNETTESGLGVNFFSESALSLWLGSMGVDLVVCRGGSGFRGISCSCFCSFSFSFSFSFSSRGEGGTGGMARKLGIC